MKYLIDGEIVDTYGGDFTYRDVYYEIENGEYIFHEWYYGAKPVPEAIITDPKEIKELIKLLNND